MNRKILAVVVVIVGAAVTQLQAGDPPRQALFAGRTFEEWRRISLDDLDGTTRNESFGALAAFGRHGKEAEAVAAIQAAIAAETSDPPLDHLKVYEAVRMLGKPGEPLLVAGLQHQSLVHQRAALSALQRGMTQLPGEALTAALLQKVADKKTHYILRDQACRALGEQISYQEQLLQQKVTEAENSAAGKPATPLVIAGVGPFLKQTLPVLEETLKDNDPRVSEAAAIALVRSVKRKPQLVATVLDYLDSQLTSPKPIPASPPLPGMTGDVRLESIEGRALTDADLLTRRRALMARERALAQRGGARTAIGGVGSAATLTGSVVLIDRTDIYSELYKASHMYREEMLLSLSQLHSLRDRHPQVRQQFEQMIMTLQSPPGERSNGPDPFERLPDRSAPRKGGGF